MKKWFIADTHFYHTNIIKYEKRPFKSTKGMNLALINNWNNLVACNDVVFVLGDFGLSTVNNLRNICYCLNGSKVGIVGNHDIKSARLYSIGFEVVFESAFIKIGRHIVELIHQPGENITEHFQLHGHVHGKCPNKVINNKLNLCVEVWDYNPVAEKTIIGLLDRALNKISGKK